MEHDDEQSITLSPEDQAALEWLLDHGLSLAGAPPEVIDRAGRLLGLLEMAGDADVVFVHERTHAVLARVAAATSDSQGTALGEDDQDALDAFVLAGYDSSRVPQRLRARAEQMAALGDMVVGGEHIEYDRSRTDRVMAAIEVSRSSVEPERPSRFRIGFRLADIVSVAAVLLVSASVVWPVLSTFRGNAARQANQANLAVAGIGFGAYASDYAGALPALSSSQDNQRAIWWQVGNPDRSNSANLFTLARLEYTPLEALASPGNPDAPREGLSESAMDWRSLDEVSYSYRLPTSGAAHATPATVILGDRSPIIPKAVAQEAISLSDNSPNHDGAGQHLLLGDGSVSWHTTPYTVYGDHVYLPKRLEVLIRRLSQGFRLRVEAFPNPTHQADVFLGP